MKFTINLDVSEKVIKSINEKHITTLLAEELQEGKPCRSKKDKKALRKAVNALFKARGTKVDIKSPKTKETNVTVKNRTKGLKASK